MANLQEQGGIATIGDKGQEYGPAYSNYNVKIGGSAARTEKMGKEYVEPAPHPIWAFEELHKWSLWRAAIAEFVATLLFVYIGVSAAIGNARESPEGVGALGVAWSFGATIFVLVYCTAGVSGGHINPAVTLGLLLGRRISIPRALLYMVAQVLGGLSGAGLVKALQKRPFQHFGGGTNFVNPELSSGTGLGAEIIGTFVLVYVVYSATDGKRRARDSHVPVLAPLPIGLAVFVVHLATIPITGTGINPARSFGPAALWGNKLAWDDQWIFWVGPFIGASLAAAYHQFIIRSLPLGSYFLFPTIPLTVVSFRVPPVIKAIEYKTSDVHVTSENP